MHLHEMSQIVCTSRDGLSKKSLIKLDQLVEHGIVLKLSVGSNYLGFVPVLPSAFF